MADDQRPSGSSSFSKQVKKRMTLSAAVKRFKSKIGSGGGGSSGTPRRTAEGYFYYPEGEVGYPVCVPVRVEPASTCCHIEVSSPSASPSAWEQQGDTTEAAECGSGAEKPRGKVERAELREPTLEERRRSSINIYQGQSKPEAIKPSPASSRVSLAVPSTITRHKVSSAKLFGLAWLGLSPRWQSVDEDHPDLQSIQNIVANMTFSAD